MIFPNESKQQTHKRNYKNENYSVLMLRNHFKRFTRDIINPIEEYKHSFFDSTTLYTFTRRLKSLKKGM